MGLLSCVERCGGIYGSAEYFFYILAGHSALAGCSIKLVGRIRCMPVLIEKNSRSGLCLET